MENLFKKFILESKKIKAKIIYNEIQDFRIKKAIYELKYDGFTPVLCSTKEILDKEFGKELEKFEYIICPDGENTSFYSAKMLGEGKVDGYISGAVATTGDTIKALLKGVGKEESVKRISGYFLINTKFGLKLFADCAVQVNPNAEQLAEIAYLSIKSAQTFGIEPRVAMLSFSTKGSSENEYSLKVKEATEIIKEKLILEDIKDIEIEGEIQLDAAFDEKVALNKIKNGSWTGNANIFIFPDLNSGNIGYKLVQYFAESQAIGPILQGLKKPGNDLSRGCSVEDIITLHAITAIQSSR